MTAACELRVALVTSSLKLAGAEKQTMYIARALRDKKIEVVCFYLGQNGHYDSVLCRLKLPVCRIYHPNKPLLILARLIHAFSRFRPHVVFAPQFGDLIQGGVAGRLSRAMVIGGLRSNGIRELENHRQRSPWMLRLAHGIVANSITAKENVLSRGVNPQKICLVPNVIDLREFDAQRRSALSLQVPDDRIVAVAVGSLQPVKRFDRFIDALALARRKVPALFGIIAGADQGCREALEQKASQAGLAPEHMTFLGECSNIPALLSQCAFLVTCSEFEGFPNTILEAMAAGLPVITTPAGDAPYIVRHNETGYVVRSGKVPDIADYMVQLANSPETRLRFGAAGKRVCREYRFETLQDNLLKAFCGFATQNRKSKLVTRIQERLSVPAPQPEVGLLAESVV